MAIDPICGMVVDERTAELRLVRENRTYFFCSTRCLQEFSQPDRELARLRVKLAIAWPLSVAILALSYVVHFPDWPWVAFLLASVVQFYPGWQFYRSTLDAVRNRNWNMDVLIALGTSIAFGYTTAVLVLPGRLPPNYYFDASSLIVTLILSGNYLEHLTRQRTGGALRKLRDMLPATARVLRAGMEVEVPVSEIQVGDRIRVLPGGRFPADGIVRSGRSTANEALLTGESLPVEKRTGDRVIAGAINGEGGVVVEAVRVGEDTLLAQIGQLVAEAETGQVPLQQLADRIASIFVPVVLMLAVVAALAWSLDGVGLTIAILILVSVVITACPCAFGIATPAAIVVGTGRAAEEGILFKGRDTLERASQIDVVLTDKTGTLTLGRPALADIVPIASPTEEEVLALAAGVELGSEHPLAQAVVASARTRGIAPAAVEDIRSEPGAGVRGRLGGEEIAILRGSAARPAATESALPAALIDRLSTQGKAWSVVWRDGRPWGLLAFSDTVAPGVADAVHALESDGISVTMVTGDHLAAARAVSDQVGIHDVRASMSPRDKLALIKQLQAEGKHVAFVGDGINDAPSLAVADLGIAIGAGTDVAQEAGGVILIRSDFRGVALALRIGRRTVRKVKGNLTWAFGYNAVLLPVAAGALVPLFGLGVYDVLPITGALAMALSSTCVVLNSISLRWVSLR
jgi:Cu+-exporting ATPase